MNLHKGFKRLTFVLSLFAGPIAFIIACTVEGSPGPIGDIIGWFLLFWVIGFLVVRGIYGLILFVVEGFRGAKGERKRRRDIMNLRRGLRRITLCLAIVAGFGGIAGGVTVIVNEYKYAWYRVSTCERHLYEARQKVADRTIKNRLAGLEVKMALEALEKAKGNFWVELSEGSFVGLCVLAALCGATVGFFGVWITFWFGGLAVYKLITWIVLGFRDTDAEQKAKKPEAE